MSNVDLWTDGGCEPNPGRGAWAVILISGPHRKELTGGEAQTTSNRMELMAVIAGLAALVGGPHSVVIHSSDFNQSACCLSR